ncbi:hypothetical protein NPIL_71751 [Nephila pilipes]|uniref:Uncharacterized protein n=1 Tax=Nephila pilipes TaxID=299642 RepID=A0A8X6UBP5_NEPPI|nr:hypothetical protein NPIL_71751 [Nephila pilipes]
MIFEKTNEQRYVAILESEKQHIEKKVYIPVVHSFIVYKMCEGLGLEVQIVSIENRKIWIRNNNEPMNMTPTILSDKSFNQGASQNFVVNDKNILSHKSKIGTKNSKLIPKVRSAMIYKLCQDLRIEAELNPLKEPTLNKGQSKKINSEILIPIVKSASILMFCNALGIDVKLDPVQDKQF